MTEENENAQEAQTNDAVQHQDVENNIEPTVENGDTPADGSDEAPDSTPKENKKPWYQKRIDILSGEKAKHARAAEEARLQAERAIEELALLRAQGIKHDGEVNPSTPPAISQSDIERLTEEKAQVIVNARLFNEACDQVYASGKKDFPDFDDALQNIYRAGEPNNAFWGNVVDKDILNEPHKVLRHLGNNPDEAADILRLNPIKQALALKKIEERLSKPVDKPISKAPAPIQTVDGRSKTQRDITDTKQPIDDWIALREKSLKDKGRRI